jgi:hypothetical protein
MKLCQRPESRNYAGVPLPNRFLLSMVMTLLFSTLVFANSTPINVPFLHFGAGVYSGTSAYPAHLLNESTKATPTMFGNAANQASTAADGNAGGSIFGKSLFNNRFTDTASTGFALQNGNFMGSRYGIDWKRGKNMATPEPGSLLLLSTGLFCVAGMLRRKLRAESENG